MPGTGRPRSTPPTLRRPLVAATVARGLMSFVALSVLVVGIPCALVALGSTSYLAVLTDLPRLASQVTGEDDGTLFLAVLTLAAWVGWATFALAVVLELAAQLRGAPRMRIRGLGVQQSIAGGLVAACLAVVLMPGAANASVRSGTTSGTPLSAITLTPFAKPVDAPAVAAREPVPRVAPRADARGYVVRRGDTLWDLAASHLGDGSRWREIAALNYGREQPDGDRLDASHRLQPGWHLTLPGAAAGAVTERPGSPRVHVVRPGETLSGIADEELGSADRWPDIVEANSSRRQPGGGHLTDPDRIYPGWTLRIPGSTTRVSAEAHRTDRPAGTGTSSAASTPSEPPARSEVGGGAVDPAWSSTGDQATGGGHGGRASVAATPHRPWVPGGAASAGASGAPVGNLDAEEDDDGLIADVVDIRTAGGVGGLLAACIILVIRARRAGQQRRRRPGQRVPIPPPSVLSTETRLRAVADVPGVSHIDLALRALAADHRARGRPLPCLRSARLTSTHLELYLTQAAELAPPWARTSDPTVWVLQREDLTAQPETDMRAPYPALVTVGHDLEDAHVLLDLEQSAALAIEGDRRETVAMLAAVAVELATSPWADDLLVTLVGCLPELPAAVATGRLRHVERLEGLITDLEGRAADVARVLREAGAPDLPTARGTGIADDTWPPEIVLLAHEVPDGLRERLDGLLHRVPRVGVAAVTAGSALGEWCLRLDAATALARLDPIGVTVRPQRLSGSEYDDVLAALRTADADATGGPGWASRLPALEQALADLPAPVPDVDVVRGFAPGEVNGAEGTGVAGGGNDADLSDGASVLHGPTGISAQDGVADGIHDGRFGDSRWDASKEPSAVRDSPPGVRPAGDRPAGDRPAGDRPAGDRSAGDRSAGDRPAGDRPAGDRPAGDRSGGDRAGDRSGGDRPAGDRPFSDDGDAAGAVVSLPAPAPYVRLLGPVEVVGAQGPEPVTLKDGRAVASHVGRATALVAFLACRPQGATMEQLSEALSPVRRLTPSTVWSLASRTRKWLGSDPEGRPYFPRTSGAGAATLHPAVRTDWSDWLGLVGQDAAATPLSQLVEALALVRGRPFEVVVERHYAWAEPLRQEMVAGIVDVSHEVVRRALLVPDAVAARRAVVVGRLVDPTNELLWRDAVRIEYCFGSRESRRRLVDQLYALADDLETDLEPETEQLIKDLQSVGTPRVAAR